MGAPRYPDSVVQPVPDFGGSPGLYDIFRVGSRMFEHPSTRGTLRLAEECAQDIAGCEIAAVYMASQGRLVRRSGRADRRLDLLMEAQEGASGPLESVGEWRYALFFRGNGKLKGAFAVRAPAEPTSPQIFLLLALAEPTGAALAAAELIERERRQARELRRLGEAQVASNRTMAATIMKLNAQQRIRDSIVTAAGAGNPEAQIVETVSILTGRSVVLQDSFGNELAHVTSAVGTGSPATGSVENLLTEEASGAAWRSVTIRSGRETLGVLGIYDPEDERSDDDRFAVEYACATLAVELAHRRNVAEVELRLGRELADDLVAGGDVVDALARAEALHFDLTGFHRVVLVAWESPTPNGIDISAAVRYQLAAMHVPALVSRRPEATLAVVADGHDLSRLYDRMSAALTSIRGTIGIGGRCTAGELPRSFAEASRALRIRAESRQPLGLSNHDDLGLLRILDTSDDGAHLQRYISEWLGALLEQDHLHRTELVRTLTAYLDAGGNYDRTSAALVIHRSTLRYRLRRIRELCGLDLNDPEARLNLHTAVRARAALTDYLH